MANTNEQFCCGCGSRSSSNASKLISSIFLAVLLGVVNLPCGLTHIASVLETDGVPGMPAKPIPRGPTVAPVPSPETLNQFEQISARGAEGDRDDDTNPTYFNPADAIRNLLSLSTHRLQSLKRVSQFHGNGDFALMGSGYQRTPPQSLQMEWGDYEENGSQDDEDGKPTFVPFIGARALTNIPQFFEHLKENIEALKHTPNLDEDEEMMEAGDEGINDSGDDEENDSVGKKDMTKPAARRMKTELLVDENAGLTQSRDSITVKQNWKPRAAGIIHYYGARPNFIESRQNVLRRANNYNPAWLYTNLGLGR